MTMLGVIFSINNPAWAMEKEDVFGGELPGSGKKKLSQSLGKSKKDELPKASDLLAMIGEAASRIIDGKWGEEDNKKFGEKIKNCSSEIKDPLILSLYLMIKGGPARAPKKIRNEQEKKYLTKVLSDQFKDELLRKGYTTEGGQYYAYQGDPEGVVDRYKTAKNSNDPTEKLTTALEFFKKLKKMDYTLEARQTGRVVNLLVDVIETKDVDNPILIKALYNLAAIFYEHHYDTDKKAAVPLLKRIKKEGEGSIYFANAMYNLGGLHLPYTGHNYGLKEYSSEKAGKYYRKASKKGHRQAALKLGEMYMKKDLYVPSPTSYMDSEKTREKALKYYRKAALGDQEAYGESEESLKTTKMLALFTYGQMLMDSRDADTKEKGKSYIKKSADMGYVDAQQYVELLWRTDKRSTKQLTSTKNKLKKGQ